MAAALSMSWTVFARSNNVIVGMNPTGGMYVDFCVGGGLATGWSPVQGDLPIVYGIKKVKKESSAQKAP
jgi:hypothetical protein